VVLNMADQAAQQVRRSPFFCFLFSLLSALVARTSFFHLLHWIVIVTLIGIDRLWC
jgi:hypothetical protein